MVSDNRLNDPNQLAYRARHSTETPIFCACDDLLCTLDCEMAVLLMLLDHSKAFDTTSYQAVFATTQEKRCATLKAAIVKTLFKKTTPDPELMKNYKPVPNLPFVSKLVNSVISGVLAVKTLIYQIKYS